MITSTYQVRTARYSECNDSLTRPIVSITSSRQVKLINISCLAIVQLNAIRTHGYKPEAIQKSKTENNNIGALLAPQKWILQA